MWYRYVAPNWVRQKLGINSAGVPKPNLRSDTEWEPDHELKKFFLLVGKVSRKKILGFGYMFYLNSSKNKWKDAFNLDLDNLPCFNMVNSVRDYSW